MFRLDSTALLLCCSIVLTTIFVGISRLRRSDFDWNGIVVVFFAALAIPAGGEMAIAAVRGSTSHLPEHWRSYSALFGVAMAYYSVDKVYKQMRSAWLFKATESTPVVAAQRVEIIDTSPNSVSPS